MIDSHSHIYCDAFDEDRDQMIARAREAGVRHIIMPNENLESLNRLKAVHDAYGLHPPVKALPVTTIVLISS